MTCSSTCDAGCRSVCYPLDDRNPKERTTVTTPAPKHYSLEDVRRIFDQLAVGEEKVIDLGPADTAYDPETGDTLLGNARITFRWGEFPGPPRTATVEPFID